MRLDIFKRLDSRVTKRIDRLPSGFRPFMEGLSFLGEPPVVLTVAAVGYATAVRRDENDARRAFLYATAAFAISTVLKLLLRRRRPHNLDVRTLGVRSYSFPSGHAFGTMIFYGLFSYLDFKYLVRPWNLLVCVLLVALIALIGISRVYLKTHYPSDVAGGWLLGFIGLLIVVGLAF